MNKFRKVAKTESTFRNYSFSIYPQQTDNDIMDILLFTKASKKQMSRSKSNYGSEGLLKLYISVERELNTRKWKTSIFNALV